MDNGTVPSDVQPPSDPTPINVPAKVPVSPAVTGPGEPGTPTPEGPEPSVSAPQPTATTAGPNPAMSEAATFNDAASKLREAIARMPLLSVAVAALAGLGAAVLLKRPKLPRRLNL